MKSNFIEKCPYHQDTTYYDLSWKKILTKMKSFTLFWEKKVPFSTEMNHVH